MRLKISVKDAYQWALLMVVPFLFASWAQHEPIRMAKVIGVGIFAGISVIAFGGGILPLPYISLLGYFFINAVITGLGQVQVWGLFCIVTALLATAPWYKANERFFENTLKALVAAGTIMSLYCMLQMVDYDPIFIRTDKAHEIVPVGFLGQQTVLGPFLVACAIAALHFNQRLLAILIALPIVFCDSSFTFLCVGVALLIVYGKRLLKYWEMALFGGVILGMLALYMRPGLLASNGRFQLWGEILNAMFTSPPFQIAFGYGGASFFSLFHNVQTKSLYDLAGIFLEAHNDLLQQFFEIGAVGVLLILWCLVDFTKRSIARSKNAVALSFIAIFFSLLANSVGNFILRLEPFGIIMCICMFCVLTMKESEYGS